MRKILAAVGMSFSISCAWSAGKDGADPFTVREVRTANGETTVFRGKSPRSDGLSYQYQNMKTPLRGNLILSDVLLPSDRWYLWDGQPTQRFDIDKQTAENYHESHNHHQSLLSEVINATAGANGIPVWGDSVAAVNGANVWGGFFSARSTCDQGDLIGKYLPKNMDRGCGLDFDAQLTGLEVDVLNAGKPGVYPNKAKHGVQIVGFGNPNGQAISVIAENFDREPQFRRGQFESILYAQNSIQPSYGRFIVMDFEKAHIGLDMRRPLFSGGAMDYRTEGPGSGILLNSGRSGEVYGGLRSPGFADPRQWLSMRLGNGGYRVVSNDNMRELMAIDNDGGIYLNGDVYLNGTQISAESLTDREVRISVKALALSILTACLLLLGGNVLLVRYLVKTTLRRGREAEAA